MKKRWKNTIYWIFFSIFLSLAIYSYFYSAQWYLDNLVSIGILTLLYFSAKRLKLGWKGFVLLNIGQLLHNFGSFGFYAWGTPWFAWDNIVHFFNSFAIAYVTFNFVARKLHVKKGKKVKKTVVDEHTAILITLVIALTAMFGVIVELVEFTGYMKFGEGEGIFFVGAGDSDDIDDIAGQYIDTMGDIIVNTLGSIFGVLTYYFVDYKKRPWLKYGG